MKNNFTTPEQSKWLLELGVPANSADCWRQSPTSDIFVRCSEELQPEFFKGTTFIPCWSVGRLNEIFKICSDNHIEIYDLDLEGTQIERAMQAFENYAKYNWLDFSKLNVL